MLSSVAPAGSSPVGAADAVAPVAAVDSDRLVAEKTRVLATAYLDIVKAADTEPTLQVFALLRAYWTFLRFTSSLYLLPVWGVANGLVWRWNRLRPPGQPYFGNRAIADLRARYETSGPDPIALPTGWEGWCISSPRETHRVAGGRHPGRRD